MKNEKVNVVIGLGEIGKPLFNLISKSEKGTTIGIDIQPVLVDKPVKIMHICIPFQVDKVFTQIIHNYALKYSPEVIVINSTVTPGTSAAVAKMTGIPTVYSPVRGKHTRMEQELLHYQKFIAGTESNAVEKIKEHFTYVGMRTVVISSPDVLELAKLMETTYFGILIAWAQEMDRFTKNVNGDYFEMAKFFEEVSYLPPVLFKPGFIGGHCVMPNIDLLKTRFKSEFLDAIVNSNIKKSKEVSSENELKARTEPLKVAR